jgi:hypothetical protein
MYSALCNQYRVAQTVTTCPTQLRRKAVACERLLSKLQDAIENGTDEKYLYDYSMCLTVTNAWHTVAKVCETKKHNKGRDHALHRLENILLDYEVAVATIAKAEASLHDDLWNSKNPHSRDLTKILSLAPSMYKDYLYLLCAVQSTGDRRTYCTTSE